MFFYSELNPPKQGNLEKILSLLLSISKSLLENIGRCNKKKVNFPFLMNPNNMVYPGQKVFSACINQFFPVILEGPRKFLTSLKLNSFVFLYSGAEICKIQRVLRLTTPEKENKTENLFFFLIFWLKLKNKTLTAIFFLSLYKTWQ